MCYCVTLAVRFGLDCFRSIFNSFSDYILVKVKSHCKLSVIFRHKSKQTWFTKSELLLFSYLYFFCGFLFAFDFYATLVCHVATALCNIHYMRTGKPFLIFFGCNVSYSLRSYFSLVLSDLYVTKHYVLCHKKRVFLVIIGECQIKEMVYCQKFTLNKNIYCCGHTLFVRLYSKKSWRHYFTSWWIFVSRNVLFTQNTRVLFSAHMYFVVYYIYIRCFCYNSI